MMRKASKKGFMNYSELCEPYNYNELCEMYNYRMKEPSTLPIQMSRKGIIRNPMKKAATKLHFAAKFSARENFSRAVAKLF